MTVKTTKRDSLNGTVDARKVLAEYVYGTGRFMEIPVDRIKIDLSYQREFAEKLVSTIVSKFDIDKYEPPTVNVRPDGTYFVVDGGHRLEAAKRLHMETVTCRVISIPVENEAMYFLELNRQRRWVTPVQTFKAELKAGRPSAIEIARVLDARGLRVSKSHSPHTVTCTGTLHKIYAGHGTVGLERVLDAVLVWSENEPRRFSGQLLQGLDLFFETNPNADRARLHERLQRVATRYLLAQASNRWHAWKSLDQRGGSLIDATAEEIKKQYLKR